METMYWKNKKIRDSFIKDNSGLQNENGECLIWNTVKKKTDGKIMYGAEPIFQLNLKKVKKSLAK